MDIKFLHYNIAACRNYETETNSVNLQRTLEIIQSFSADIITLNEVDCLTKRSGCVNQPEIFSKALGYNYYFAPSIELEGGLYGIALFTKYEILSAKTIKIPDSYDENGEPFEKRIIVSAVLNVCGRKLRIIMSHYGLTHAQQEKAVEYTLQQLQADQLPTVFSGDLNMTPDSRLVKKLSQHMTDSGLLLENGVFSYPTHEFTQEEKVKIDYVFTYGDIKVQKALIPDIHVSDHRPYYCELIF